MASLVYLALLLLILWFWQRKSSSVKKRPYQTISSKPGTFRILELLPGHEFDSIRGYLLVTTTESEQGTYEALSYAWDQEPITWEKISLNGIEHRITKGLNGALIALRHRDVSRKLWIDQICINQLDDAEVSGQMEMMREIYENASRTIIWLGESMKEDVTITALVEACKPFRQQVQWLAEDDVKRLGAQPTLDPALVFAHHLGAFARHDPRFDIPSGLRSPGPLTQQNILLFFRRRWFVRLWPFMEVIVSKNHLVVQYGNNQVEWADLGFAVHYLMHSKVLTPVANQNRRGLEAANWVHMYWMLKKKEFPLIEMLRAARKYDAEKANDKVFAILGLTNEVQQLRQQRLQIPLSLRIDTRLDTCTVYRQIAEFLLERDKNLMVLSLVQHPCETINPKLPSWVPDWSQREIGTPLWIPGMPDEGCYDANPWSVHHPSLSIPGRYSSLGLVVSGYVLAKIKGDPLSCITQSDVDAIEAGIDGSARKLFGWILAMSKAKLEEKMMVLTTGRIGAKLIPRDHLRYMKHPFDEHVTQFCAFIRDLTPALARGRGMPPSEMWEQDALRKISAVDADKADGSTMKSAVLNACRDRKLFLTTMEKSGLGPPTCRAGDLVCILDGGRVPFILREKVVEAVPNTETEPTYQLIGECYVYDFMFGKINDVRHTSPKQQFILY